MAVWEVNHRGTYSRLADPNSDDLRDRNRTFSAVAKFAGVTSVAGGACANVTTLLLELGRLDSISALLPNPDLFLYSYVRKEAVVSSQIEETRSSLSDLLLFEVSAAPGVPLDDVVEVSNYVAALERRVRAAACRLADMVQHDRERVRAIGRGALTALQVHEALQREPVTTIPRLVTSTKLSVPGATAARERLVALDLVREVTGRQRGRVYSYAPYVSRKRHAAYGRMVGAF